MPQPKLSPHEELYLHEILSLKNTCAIKAVTVQGTIQDPVLKGLLSQEIMDAKRQMQELQDILSSAVNMQ
jgi:hypothetical protein